MDKDTFIDFFRNGTLGNKVKCGKYYVRHFKEVSFLLRIESDETNPRMLWIKDRVGNCWRARRGQLDHEGIDITHWKVIDNLKYNRGDNVTLFSIDGTHYLHDINTRSLQTLDDWINYRDQSEGRYLSCILKLKKHCRTVNEARTSLAEGLPEGTLIYREGLLIPSKPNITFITPELVHTAQWQPNITAFNLPIANYQHNALKVCKVNDEAFVTLTENLSSNDRDRVAGFLNLYRKYQEATCKLHTCGVIPKQTAERYDLIAQSVGLDEDDDTTHVKGKIYEDTTKELLITLPGWHKLVKFYNDRVEV